MMTSSNGNLFRVTGPFQRGINRSLVKSPHKGQWRGALMFSLICVSTNSWVNNRSASDLRRHRDYYGIIVMMTFIHYSSTFIYDAACPIKAGAWMMQDTSWVCANSHVDQSCINAPWANGHFLTLSLVGCDDRLIGFFERMKRQSSRSTRSTWSKIYLQPSACQLVYKKVNVFILVDRFREWCNSLWCG